MPSRSEAYIPLVWCDYWISRKQRGHYAQISADERDMHFTKDLGDLLRVLTDAGHTSARVATEQSEWIIDFRPAAPLEPSKEEQTHG